MNREARDDPADSRVAWFVTLERAKTVNDFEAAAGAIRELKRLGVLVKYTRSTSGDGQSRRRAVTGERPAAGGFRRD